MKIDVFYISRKALEHLNSTQAVAMVMNGAAGTPDPADYEFVGMLEINTKSYKVACEEAFRHMQDVGNGQRSMMPGDLLVVNRNVFACKALGFELITDAVFTMKMNTKIAVEGRTAHLAKKPEEKKAKRQATLPFVPPDEE